MKGDVEVEVCRLSLPKRIDNTAGRHSPHIQFQGVCSNQSLCLKVALYVTLTVECKEGWTKVDKAGKAKDWQHALHITCNFAGTCSHTPLEVS